MTTVALAIFGLSYLLIASHRLPLLPIGRPAGALLGAALMVAAGVLTPRESYAAIDHDTLLLLFAMMLLTAYLERAGFFEAVAGGLLGLCAGRPAVLLGAVALLAGGLSALLVNDTVCLFLTPVLVELSRISGLPAGPLLMALATSSNIGSSATLVGNPQNMIIGSLSRMPFRTFLLRAGPAALASLLLNTGLLWLFYRRKLQAVKRPPEENPKAKEGAAGAAPRREGGLTLPVTVALGIVACFFAGLHLGYSALTGVLVLVVAERRDPRAVLARVDFSLLVFFAGLFIVVAGLAKTGIVERTWAAASPVLDLSSARGLCLFSALMTAGSNLVSNVPMVLVTGPHLHELHGGPTAWILLAFTTTVAGNLTLVGSVANIIVAEGARDHHRLGFFEYLRFGAASTLLVLLLGVSLIHLEASLLGPA